MCVPVHSWHDVCGVESSSSCWCFAFMPAFLCLPGPGDGYQKACTPDCPPVPLSHSQRPGCCCCDGPSVASALELELLLLLVTNINQSTIIRAREELRKRVNMSSWNDKCIIAVVSRLTPQKGVHLIKHAAYKVCLEVVDMCVLVVGWSVKGVLVVGW